MKKSILLAVFTLIFTGFVNAQSSENVVKGMHGGIVFGLQELKFEFVEKGSDVLIYPVAADGSMLKTVPTKADIIIVPQSVRNGQTFNNVQFENGCFKVTREDAILPLYIVAVNTTYNDKRIEAKYSNSNLPVK